jgi:DNA polymerase-3 subunit epsilon
MSHLKSTTLVCLDCETTGLDPKNDRIIEIALIAFKGVETVSSFESLVNPECLIPEASYDIHKISQEMLKGKPKVEQVLPEILQLIGKCPIVGHGIDFDIQIILEEAARAGIHTTIQNNPRIDTVRLARLYGESPSNSLETLRNHFSIQEEGAHRAMNDVTVNIQVFQRLTHGYTTISEILQALAKPIIMKHMPLGKYKGRLFKELPLDYLQWAVRQKFDQDLIYSIKQELQRRKKGNLFSQASNPFQSL